MPIKSEAFAMLTCHPFVGSIILHLYLLKKGHEAGNRLVGYDTPRLVRIRRMVRIKFTLKIVKTIYP